MAFRILLTSVGGALATDTVRCLKSSKRHAVEVIGVDMHARAAAQHFVDHFATVPAGSDPDYVAAMTQIAEQYRPDLVLPCSDEEALALSRARDRGKFCAAQLACVSARTLEIMSDKFETYAVLKDSGVSVPDCKCVSSRDDLYAATEQFQQLYGEFVVKPNTARGGRSVFVVRDDVGGSTEFNGGREVHTNWKYWIRDHLSGACMQFPVIVMERLFAPVFDIDSLSLDGRLLRTCQRQRINPAGVPFQGSILENRADLEVLASSITRALSLSWLYDFDVMSARNGDPRVIEVNPRPSGSIAASVASGIPILDDLISMVLGEPLPAITKRAGITIRPFTTAAEART